jgi:hypothetical protein
MPNSRSQTESRISREWSEELAAEYRQLVVRITDQRERADRLRALADQLEEASGADEALLAEFEGLVGAADQLTLEQLDPRLRGQRLQEVALEVLSRERRPGEDVHYREWFELLREAGYLIGGRDPLATFLATVARSPEVERVGSRSGRYRLRRAA